MSACSLCSLFGSCRTLSSLLKLPTRTIRRKNQKITTDRWTRHVTACRSLINGQFAAHKRWLQTDICGSLFKRHNFLFVSESNQTLHGLRPNRLATRTPALHISVIWLRFYKNSIQLFVQIWSERRRRRKRRVQRTAALWRTSEDRRRRKQTQRPLPPQPRWTQLSVTLRFKKKTKKRHKPTSVSLPVVKRSPAQPSNNNQNRKREQSELQRDEAHSETSEETCEDASLLPQPAAYSLTRPESHQFV